MQNKEVDGRFPESCAVCRKLVYKGDDEQYCQAKKMREITLLRWQKKPRWCPLEGKKRLEEWEARQKAKEQATNEGNV